MDAILDGKKHIVIINSELSSGLSCDTGVPQGSILRPQLFSLHINDFTTLCNESNIQMYADNTVIYVHATCNKLHLRSQQQWPTTTVA